MSTDANAPGARPSLGHIRGLDGIRTFAVLSIIAFHSGLSSVPGGFYGVDAFFVLSGYLITSLLVKEWGRTETIRLGRFWAGRAGRLLPGLFLMVAVVGTVMAVWPQLLATQDIVGDAVSTVFYFSNWFSIHGGVSYFDPSSQPSPFLHTWSLAIEEQFYLVWPLVVLAVLRGGPRRRRAAGDASPAAVPVLGGGRVRLLGACRPDQVLRRRARLQVLFGLACLGSLASALLMGLLAPDGYSSRAYYGTDCRAQALLVGAAISIGLTLWSAGAARPWFTRLAGGLGLAGVAGTVVLWCTVSESSTLAFSGGFLLASLAAGGVVLGCVAAPRSLVVRFLELPPLPQWGRISYGIYLWYWPVLLVMSGQRLQWGVYPLFAARVGVTLGLAALSYHFVEMPIRRGALRSWRSWVALPVGATLAVGAVVASTLVSVGAAPIEGTSLSVATVNAASTGATPGGANTSPGLAPAGAGLLDPAPPAPGPAAAPAERKVKVLVVGDSVAGTLAVGLAQAAQARGDVQIVDEGLPGCSVATTGEIRVSAYTVPAGSPCDTGTDGLFDQWRRWVDAYNPDVVVYVARAETFDQEVGGQWENIGQPSFDSYLIDRFRDAVDVLGARGAAVVLMTSPYYDGGAQPSGAPWPEDAPSRVQLDNTMLRQVAATSETAGGHPVYVFDLNQVVSPGGQYSATVGPVNVRCGDGVHFSPSGGIFVGLRLLPDLLDLGQSHAAAAPEGAWPGPLPPSTPTWYSKLPC